MQPSKKILPIIVIAQFFCTSLWFAGNGVMQDLISSFQLQATDLGHLTAVVQLGFIIGTLLFAILAVADRFSPSKVFFYCALLAAAFNLGVCWEGNSFNSLLTLRFATGFFLAGIYPVGMKIAADYYKEGLGKSLGFLVGALVLGTAFPHLLKEFSGNFSWKWVLVITSSLALLGGLMMLLFVPDGPHRKASQTIRFSAFLQVFKKPKFQGAAFGYFGHMWELYTFWAFVPVMLTGFQTSHSDLTLNIPLWSFSIIAIGGLACVLGGYLSQRFGVQKMAAVSLTISGICCLLSPFFFVQPNVNIFLAFLLVWGAFVVMDSPLFSTLVAQNAPTELKGTALTIVNSLGFALTIVSLQLITILESTFSIQYIFIVLAVGPILGLIALQTKRNKNQKNNFISVTLPF